MSPEVNSIHKTNVPDVRVRFRHTLLQEEKSKVSAVLAAPYSVPEKGERSGSVLSTTSTFKLQQVNGAGVAGPKPLSNIILEELETLEGALTTVSASPSYTVLNNSDGTGGHGRTARSAMTDELTSEDDLLVGVHRGSRSRSLGSNNDNGSNGSKRRRQHTKGK
jgi:hypothetical protein